MIRGRSSEKGQENMKPSKELQEKARKYLVDPRRTILGYDIAQAILDLAAATPSAEQGLPPMICPACRGTKVDSWECVCGQHWKNEAATHPPAPALGNIVAEIDQCITNHKDTECDKVQLLTLQSWSSRLRKLVTMPSKTKVTNPFDEHEPCHISDANCSGCHRFSRYCPKCVDGSW